MTEANHLKLYQAI